ncbi:MAG: hypothetical protein HQ582_10025, partial [Planctomycetes bacterium]|nr:hypothetical protein [Planctomycetota bacterium]
MANTLVTQLEDMTGLEFASSTNKTTGPGIYLLRSGAGLTARYPALAGKQPELDVLATKGVESFWIYSNGSDSLSIVGNSDDALRLGRYYYLQQLGW